MACKLIWKSLAIAGGLVIAAATPVNAEDKGCSDAGKLKFACVSGNAEDVADLPGSDWIAISGTLRAVNVKTMEEVNLFPAAARLDMKTYPNCPGPLTGQEAADKKIHAHGINVRPGANGVHTLYDVHHGGRETIEVFEIDVKGKAPVSTWVGCVPSAPDAGFNGLAVLPNGGLAVTSFTRRSMGGFIGEKGKQTRARLTAGEDVSEIWEWQPGEKEWHLIPGSQGPGLNGLEASKDGKYLYASGWATGDIIRYTRGQNPPERKVIAHVDFHPDNMRWQPDGTLITAGQFGTVDDVLEECLGNKRCTKTASSVAIVDPNAGTVRVMLDKLPSNENIDLATAGQIKNGEIWVGSIGRGARIARIPLP